jgi:hypothetical protein
MLPMLSHHFKFLIDVTLCTPLKTVKFNLNYKIICLEDPIPLTN